MAVWQRLRLSISLTTLPMIPTAGDEKLADSAISAMEESVPRMVFCSGMVAQRTMAMGVFSGAPWEMSFSVILRRDETPMRKTFVPGAVASCW